MSLSIDRLELTLPAGLGPRKHAIQRLFRQELARLDWPAAQWSALVLPTVTVDHATTNLGVARRLARHLHDHAWQRSNGLPIPVDASPPGCENSSQPSENPPQQGGAT